MKRFCLTAAVLLCLTSEAAKAQAVSGGVPLSTPVSTPNGGTGAALTPTVGSVLYADTTGSYANLPDVAVGLPLVSGGLNTAPSYSTSLSNMTSISASTATLTADAPSLNINQTWNSSGTIFHGAIVDISSTASDPSSSALDLQFSSADTWSFGSSRFSVANGNSMGVYGSGGIYFYNPTANGSHGQLAISGNLTGTANVALLGIGISSTFNNTANRDTALYIAPSISTSGTGAPIEIWVNPTAYSGGSTGYLELLQTDNVTHFSVTDGGASAMSAVTISNGTLNLSQVAISTTAPTLSGSGLGTSPSITSNGTVAGLITVGSSPSNAAFTMTMPTASNGWACSLNDETSVSSVVVAQASHATTTATFQAYSRTTGSTTTLAASDKISYQCLAY